jgi:dienelactone hydrolase
MKELKIKKSIRVRLMSLVVTSALLFSNFAFAEESIEYLKYSNEKVRLDIYNPELYRIPVVILIHGSAGIEGDRAERYRGFATDIMNKGMIAINVHYFDSGKENWIETIIQTIDYVKNIENADTNRIGIVGYSLGGTIALLVSASDKRVKVLALNAGSLPGGFTIKEAVRLPKTLMICGSNDTAINALNKLEQWFKELGKPFETKINEGLGHDSPPDVFQENWQAIVKFMVDNL